VQVAQHVQTADVGVEIVRDGGAGLLEALDVWKGVLWSTEQNGINLVF
jgi:hypothetical protein